MKIFYSILGIITLVTPSFSQSSVEVSIGPSFTNVSVRGLNATLRPDRTLHTGLQAQVLFNQNIGAGFEFSTGLAYKEKGFHVSESINMNVLNIPTKVGVEANTTMRYLEVPLDIKYTLTTGPIDIFAFAGPTIGYAMSGDVRTKANFILDFNINKTTLDLNQKIYNRFEIGGNAGMGIGLPIGDGMITAHANYSQGFNKVIDNTVIDLRLKNYGFGMNIGYKINI